jgi:uncharacterized membrane protein
MRTIKCAPAEEPVLPSLMTSRHRNFYLAIALGLLVGASMLALSRDLAVVVGVNVFFLVYLLLTAVKLRKLSADHLRKYAADEDEPALFILVVMFAAVAVSAVSLFLVLHGADSVSLQLVLGVVSVLLGWFAVHTMWAIHYAFEYYLAPAEERGKKKTGKVREGLVFPGGEDPNGVAFFYFAYVIGMTAQTSDTDVTSNAMRRLVLLHGVFSFFFNTVIVAAAVNIAVALAH